MLKKQVLLPISLTSQRLLEAIRQHLAVLFPVLLAVLLLVFAFPAFVWPGPWTASQLADFSRDFNSSGHQIPRESKCLG